MKFRWHRGLQPALVGLALAAIPLGCTGRAPGDDLEPGTQTEGSTDSANPTDSETGPEAVGWFQPGWGESEFVPLVDGDPFTIVRGGQGAEMFPMPLRGGEFYLPANPTTWMDLDGPLVDVDMDVEGYNVGIGGHFKHIANYTLDWVIEEDGTYQSTFLPIIVPDGIDSAELEGLPAHLWIRVRPEGQPELVRELDVVIAVQPAEG